MRWELPESNGGLTLTHFTIYYDLQQTGSYESVLIIDTFQRTYTLSEQTYGEIVDFKITASNVNGESIDSDVLTVYIATEPVAPF